MSARLDPSEFPDWTAYYREYQSRLAIEVLLPVLREWGRWRDGVRVLDVGCGDGGAAIALAAAGAQVEAIELDPRRLEGAREESARRGVPAHFQVADITRAETLDRVQGPFELILFRDVLEHIPDRDAALRESRARLAPEGAVVVIFPPYFSPYGGHQQTLHPPRRLGVRWARWPWAHCLPRSLFRSLAAGRDGSDDPEWPELETIARSRLSLAAMDEAGHRAGLRRARARHYLLRPSFRLRYGLPVLEAGILANLPGIRELAITASYQLWTADQRM